MLTRYSQLLRKALSLQVSLVRAADALTQLKGDNADETTGIQIVTRAIEEPLRQIVANAGNEGSVVVSKAAQS